MGHANQKLVGNIRVVYHEAWETLGSHAYVEDQLWIDLQCADEGTSFIVFQCGAYSLTQKMLH